MTLLSKLKYNIFLCLDLQNDLNANSNHTRFEYSESSFKIFQRIFFWLRIGTHHCPSCRTVDRDIVLIPCMYFWSQNPHNRVDVIQIDNTLKAFCTTHMTFHIIDKMPTKVIGHLKYMSWADITLYTFQGYKDWTFILMAI